MKQIGSHEKEPLGYAGKNDDETDTKKAKDPFRDFFTCLNEVTCEMRKKFQKAPNSY